MALRFKFPDQRGGGAALAKVGGDDGAPGADGLEFLGQRPHRLDAPGGKNEIVTVPRQFAREIGADAAGGAGDEGKGATGCLS